MGLGSDVFIQAASGISLEWTNVSFTRDNLPILSSVSGMLESNKLTAVIGPSGSGKSAMISVLAGRLLGDSGSRKVSGDISVCGEIVQPRHFRSNVGSVMSGDKLFESATPYELFTFNASLRVMHSSASDRKRAVDDLIRALQLERIKNTPLFSEGISPGERQRVLIGLELIGDPIILLLDEPFKDLDSFSAYTCASILKDLSLNGVPVLVAMQRPSTEVLSLVDSVIVMANGRTLYHGPVATMADHFSRLAKTVIAENYNAADFVLLAISNGSELDLEIAQREAFKNTEQSLVPRILEKRQVRKGWVRNMVRPRQRQPILTQLRSLMKRELRDTLRNKFVLFTRFTLVGLLNFVLSAVFWKIGGQRSESYYEVNQGEWKGYYGGLSIILISAMFMNSHLVLIQFPVQRQIFLKEYTSNMYGAVGYFMARTFTEVPLSFVQSVVQMLVMYWSMNLQGAFMDYVLIVWLVCVSSASFATLLSSTVSSEARAIQLSSVIYIPQILFSGLFLNLKSINLRWINWLQYACYIKYCLNFLFFVEFDDTMPNYASRYDIADDKKDWYLILVFFMLIGARGLAFIVLRHKSNI